MKRTRPDDESVTERGGDEDRFPRLPKNNPYVGSFHRGAEAAAKRKKKAKAKPNTEDFVQQFLPLGMMMAAVSRSKGM
jgi:hypothetical protein